MDCGLVGSFRAVRVTVAVTIPLVVAMGVFLAVRVTVALQEEEE